MEQLFIFASCVELAMGMLEMCRYEFAAKRIILWGFFLIYLLTALKNKYSGNEKKIFFIMMLLGGLLYIHSGINTGMKATVYIMALKEIDIRRLFRYMVITMLIMFAAIFVLAIFFDFGMLYLYDKRENRGFGGLRFSLGFSNPNLLQIAFFGTLSYVFLICGDRISWKKWTCIMAVYMGVSFLTNSLTGMLVGGFVGISVLTVSKVKIRFCPELLMGAFICMLAFFIVVSFLAALDVEKGLLLNAINEFTSERMNQLQYYTNNEIYALPYMKNWTLFSSRSNKNFYDMGYIQIFYYYGIVLACCYLAFVIYSVRQAQRKKDALGIVLIMGLCMYLFMESQYFSNYLTRDFLLMVSAGVMWRTDEEKISLGI